MNAITQFRLCTLTNKELGQVVNSGIDALYETGKIPTRHIPARPNQDFDLLVGELLVRFLELTSTPPAPRPLSSLHPSEWDELCWLAFKTKDTVCFSLVHDNERLIDVTVSCYSEQQLLQLTISPDGRMQASAHFENDATPMPFAAVAVVRYLDSIGIALR